MDRSNLSIGGQYEYAHRFERACGDAAVPPARSLDAKAPGGAPGGCFMQPARLRLRALAFLPEVPPGAKPCSATGAPSAHESDNDGTLRRTGDRPRHSTGRGEDAHADAYRR